MELHVGIPAKLSEASAAARQCSSHILAMRVTVRGSDVDLIAKENVSHASRNESDLQLRRERRDGEREWGWHSLSSEPQTSCTILSRES